MVPTIQIHREQRWTEEIPLLTEAMPSKTLRQKIWPDFFGSVQHATGSIAQRYVALIMLDILALWEKAFKEGWKANAWNDLLQGNATANHAIAQDIITDILVWFITNVDAYANYCTCSSHPVCPKITPEMLCKTCFHPHRITLANWSRDELYELSDRNSPECIQIRCRVNFHDILMDQSWMKSQHVKYYL